MTKNNHIVIILIGLGIMLLTAGAMASPPETDKPLLKNNDHYPKPDEFIPVEQMPEMIYEEVPVYPELAKNAGIEGKVWIKSLINKKGEVVKAMIFKSSDSKVGFDESALNAAYKCKFTPAIQNKQPVAVWITYKVSFVLDKDKEK